MGEPGEAGAAAREAGRRALAAGRLGEALERYREAVGLLERADPAPPARRALAEALLDLGRLAAPEEGVPALERAEELLGALGSEGGPARGQAALTRARREQERWRAEASGQAAATAREAWGQAAPAAALGESWALSAAAARQTGRWAEGLEAAAQGLAALGAGQEEELACRLLAERVALLRDQGQLEAAHAACDELERRCAGLEDEEERVQGALARGTLLLDLAQDPEAALRHVEAGVTALREALGEEAEEDGALARAEVLRARTLSRANRAKEALELARRARATLAARLAEGELTLRADLAAAAREEAMPQLLLKQPAEALPCCLAALTELGAIGGAGGGGLDLEWSQAQTLARLGTAALHLGQVQQAGAALAQACELLNRLHQGLGHAPSGWDLARALLALADVSRRAAQPEEGRQAALAAVSLIGRLPAGPAREQLLAAASMITSLMSG